MIAEFILIAIGIGIAVVSVVLFISFLIYILFIYNLWMLEVIYFPLSVTLIPTWYINILVVFCIWIQAYPLKKHKCSLPFFSILDISIIIDFFMIFVIIGIAIFTPETMVEPFKTEKNTVEDAKYNFWFQYGFLLVVNLCLISLPSFFAMEIKKDINELEFLYEYKKEKMNFIV